MTMFDVCSRKFYIKDGEQKVKYYKAGTMKKLENGRIFLHLFHQPDTEFFVFEKPDLPAQETTSEIERENSTG